MNINKINCYCDGQLIHQVSTEKSIINFIESKEVANRINCFISEFLKDNKDESNFLFLINESNRISFNIINKHLTVIKDGDFQSGIGEPTQFSTNTRLIGVYKQYFTPKCTPCDVVFNWDIPIELKEITNIFINRVLWGLYFPDSNLESKPDEPDFQLVQSPNPADLQASDFICTLF